MDSALKVLNGVDLQWRAYASRMTSSALLLEMVTAEVAALHVEFQQWMCGEPGSLDRVDQVLADDFHFVGPQGIAIVRADLLSGLHAARGGRLVSIRTQNVAVVWQRGPIVGASYEEWQQTSEQTTARISSVVFEVADALPGGLRWLSVHETFLPGKGESSAG